MRNCEYLHHKGLGKTCNKHLENGALRIGYTSYISFYNKFDRWLVIDNKGSFLNYSKTQLSTKQLINVHLFKCKANLNGVGNIPGRLPLGDLVFVVGVVGIATALASPGLLLGKLLHLVRLGLQAVGSDLWSDPIFGLKKYGRHFDPKETVSTKNLNPNSINFRMFAQLNRVCLEKDFFIESDDCLPSHNQSHNVVVVVGWNSHDPWDQAPPQTFAKLFLWNLSTFEQNFPAKIRPKFFWHLINKFERPTMTIWLNLNNNFEF